MSSAPTMIYRLVCVIVQDDHTGSPLRYHIENYDVSCRRMLTAPYNGLPIDMWIRTGRPHGVAPPVSYRKLRCIVLADANRPYNGLSIGICIRTRRPCGVAPTELSFTLLFRGGLMLTASTTVYLLVFAFVQGDHAGSPLRVLAVITLGSPQQKNNDVYDVMCM
ncbi:MAG: hypothetical protein OKBPIBMD_00248 [Chlorobi bacterium]|nr:hypothetical protein [Chlorobiota bacterium]